MSLKSRIALTNNLIKQLIISHPEVPPEFGIIGSELILKYAEEHPNMPLDTKIEGIIFNRETKSVVLYLNSKSGDFFLTSENKHETTLTKSAACVSEVPWGTHLCQFYESKEDLVKILVPYFAEGLRGNEFCMWVTSLPLEVDEAKKALQKEVPVLNQYIKDDQIEILSYTDWYLQYGKFDADRVFQRWVEKEKDALNRGFDGLRVTGNMFWVERNDWASFTNYEAAVNSAIKEHRMIALCTYSLERCTAGDMVDVIKNHVGTFIGTRRLRDSLF